MQQMPHTLRTRAVRIALVSAVALTLGPAALRAQATLPPWQRRPPIPATARPSTIPATPPTSEPNTLPAPPAATPATTPAHRAQVTSASGLIAVQANNSSLHQILRAISRRTGMTITGSIADVRVFGDYGPAPAATILATLIDGTGVNMLFQAGDAAHPPSLVLTPQTGSPAHVNATPIAQNADDESAQPAPPAEPSRQAQQPQQPPANYPTQRTATRPSAGANPPPSTSGANNQITTPPSIPQPLNNVNGSPANTSPTASTLPTTNSVPIDSIPTPSTTPSSSGIVDSPNPPAPGSTTSTTPSGPATPEQIYQELLQMQQKQQKPSSNTQPQ